MFHWRLLSRQIHLCHIKYIYIYIYIYIQAASFSSPEDSSVHTIVSLYYTQLESISFDSGFTGPFCSCVLLGINGKQFVWRILSKGSKVGIRNFF